jgi:hypothetical protein
VVRRGKTRVLSAEQAPYLGALATVEELFDRRALVTPIAHLRFSPGRRSVGARVSRSASALPRLFWVVAQSPGTAPPCLQTLLELRVCKPPGIGATLKSGFKMEISG